MNVEEYIVARVNALMHTQDAAIVKRLEGGMSNYTYVVETRCKRYTYRVPGKYAEKFVDRVEEWDNIQEVNKLDLNNATSYVEIISGEKLAEYVDGVIMSETDVVSYNDISVQALKKIHNSDLHFKDYNAFGRLSDYERYCREMGFTHPKEYVEWSRCVRLIPMCPWCRATATISPQTLSSAVTSSMSSTGSLPG